MTLCATCGGEFQWIRRGGKWHALNADGLNHWANCAGARTRRKANALRIIPGRRITGEAYRPCCEQCGISPWELCPCSDLQRAH